MSNLIERMSLIVPVISIVFIFVITSINLFVKIRRIFPIIVNCWFCNRNASVPYRQFNNWVCGHCEQYNGFNEDGDYNCDIPAQRSIQLNKRWETGESASSSYVASTSQRNRLCENCNRNQEIKVQQLASFEPRVEENFDMEIEHFRDKLEKSYELCYACQRCVKKSLNRIMNNVLGLRLAQIGGNSLRMLDRHVKKADSKKRTIFNRVCLLAITVLSVWNLCNSSKSGHLTRNHFDIYFPPLATRLVLIIISFISAVKLLIMEYTSAIIFFNIDFENICSFMAEDAFKLVNDHQIDFIINLAAVLLSLKLVLTRCSGRLYSLSLMFLWNVNMLWPTIAGSVMNDFFGDLFKIVFGIIILFVVSLLNYTLSEKATYKCRPTNNSFHRIYSNCEEDLSDNSDSEACSSNTSKRDYELSNLKNSFSTTKLFSPDASNSTSCVYLSKDMKTLPRSQDQNSSWYQQCNQDLSEPNMISEQLYPFRIPDDCQNKLTDLNISGISRRNDYTITCSAPTPSILLRDHGRTQILTPSRLNCNDHSSLSASATKTSWVAGGFFVKNNLSPHKRQQPQSVIIHPISSRTSSLSSGFESRGSSAHNGCTSCSRESSVAGDVASNFSEPTLIADSSLSAKLPNYHSFSLITKNQTTFNSTSCRPESYYADDKKLTSLSKSIYHQFGTHRLNLNDNQSVFNKFPYHTRKTCKENIVKNNSIL